MALVLVVDDNERARRLIREALPEHTVAEAPDGRSALEALHLTIPDLILIDLVLPDVDSLRLARSLRALLGRRPVPVLALTTPSPRFERVRLASAGFDDVVLKPIQPARLSQTVSDHLAGVPSEPSRGGSLLVVEDDPVQSKVLSARLSAAGYLVTTAETGTQALDMLRADVPDAILCDILMPRLDGYRFCLRVREELGLQEIPIILMSSSFVDGPDRELAWKAGATSCVVKTTGMAEVLATLETVLSGGSGTNGNPLPASAFESDHAQRMLHQLQRQVALNGVLADRCATLQAGLSILGGIATALSQDRELGAALDDVLMALCDAGDVTTAALLLFQAEGVTVRSVGAPLWSAGVVGDLFGDLEALREPLGRGETLNERSLGDYPGLLDELLRTGQRFALLIPILWRRKLVGTVLLTSPRPRQEADERDDLLASASAQLAQGAALAHAFSEKRRTLRRARESEAAMRSMMDCVADGIIVVDGEGNPVYSNPAAERILGSSWRSLPLKAWPRRYGLYLPDRRTVYPAEHLPLALALRGEDVNNCEVFARNDLVPHGIWLSVNARPQLDDEGRPCGAVAVFRDVTMSKSTQEQLLVSERMASVGLLAAGLVHEINNPLGAVIGYAQLASDCLAEQDLDDAGQAMKDVSEAAQRIHQLVRDLRLFSRSESGDTEPIDVHRVLESTLRIAYHQIRNRARLVKDYGKTPLVEGHESRLGQVFLNLVVNAAQAIPHGQELNHVIRLATRPAGSEVVVEVTDSGQGMSPEVLEQLFRPFFTTKQTGTGLGLSICQRILNEIGGRIEVSSQVGEGTTFRVFLPMALAD